MPNWTDENGVSHFGEDEKPDYEGELHALETAVLQWWRTWRPVGVMSGPESRLATAASDIAKKRSAGCCQCGKKRCR